jgi:hypothetical protein
MTVNSFQEHPLKPKRAFDPHFTFTSHQEKRCRKYHRMSGQSLFARLRLRPILESAPRNSAKAQCACRLSLEIHPRASCARRLTLLKPRLGRTSNDRVKIICVRSGRYFNTESMTNGELSNVCCGSKGEVTGFPRRVRCSPKYQTFINSSSQWPYTRLAGNGRLLILI